MMKKGSIHQEDTIIINMYAPNNRKPKTHKANLTEINGETDNSTTVGDIKSHFPR